MRQRVHRSTLALGRMKSTDLLTALRALELQTHDPAVRISPARLGKLLHRAFSELGRNGRQYSRSDVLAEFAGSPPKYRVVAQGFTAVSLSRTVAILTYRSAHVGKGGRLSGHTARFSLWQMSGRNWKLRFHQGTPSRA